MKKEMVYFISGNGAPHEVNEVKTLAGYFNKIHLVGCPKENEGTIT